MEGSPSTPYQNKRQKEDVVRMTVRVINSLRKDVVGERRSRRTQKVLGRPGSDRRILTEDNNRSRHIFSPAVTRIGREDGRGQG